MGNPTPTKEDLLAIAYVSISEDGEVISKRKISFINKAIEILEDALDKKIVQEIQFYISSFLWQHCILSCMEFCEKILL